MCIYFHFITSYTGIHSLALFTKDFQIYGRVNYYFGTFKQAGTIIWGPKDNTAMESEYIPNSISLNYV